LTSLRAAMSYARPPHIWNKWSDYLTLVTPYRSAANRSTKWLTSNRPRAEFRVSAQANRVCETRNFDEPAWKKAMSRSAAIETTLNDVGYVPP
jgi:hypothetical protein